MNSASAAAASTGSRPSFTASQWQELEHQALIFKYLIAGLPVPPELVLPIRKSFESMSARFFHPSSMGYCSFYGKKVDPEPGRCRRTDGKKWRCSKDAYADSKYCERHMHRGRNRSRKPVETQTISPSSSTVTSLTTTGSSSGSGGGAVGGGGSGGGGCFQSLPLHSISNPQGHCSGGNLSQLQMQMEPVSYGIGSRDYRYLHGLKSDVDERSFFSEASGSLRGIGMDSSLDNPWRLMPSRVSSFPPSKSRNGSILEAEYPQLHSFQDLGHEMITTASLAKQQQHCFFGSEFGSSEPVTVKQEVQSLRPFFDEWPKTRDSWSDLEDDRSNRTSFSTTQLSISIPMASSDFSAASSQSPNDD
ncbi:growth-regulating factor 4-like [Telopea speciosissima]|uniref:growth-regulating factor 4-like n=1 Tax=Telopea speciosissima TaxID=54955 RepID=UPI001CC56B64|nr:growth-regulating factor 4-like [Telopea speciosissima]